MKYLLSLSILFFSLSNGQAQDFCKASSIFFDLNKSKVKPAGTATIDSLVKSMNGADFILEIYGYTDTSNTADYNRKLSQSRIDAVLAYLKSQKITPKEIWTFNEGEDFNSNNQNKNAAFQRRVDVYITPMEGNDVVFKASNGVVVKRDLSSFGDCGICALRPKMTFLQTENEASANGIDLVTDKGEKLVTFGMVLFDIDTCSSIPAEEREKFETCMEVPALSWNDRVKLFELVEQSGNDVWRLLGDSIVYDPDKKVARFCSRARRINCDQILDWYKPGPLHLVFPEESLKGKSFFIHREPKKAEQLFNDTVNFPNGIETVVSYFRKDADWYLFRESAYRVETQFLNRDSVSPSTCLIYVPDYRIAPAKRSLELKVKLENVEKIGYYLADFDLFVPFVRTEGTTYIGQMYEDGFELCYLKKGRYYVEKNHAKKLKIKTKNGHSKAKLKKSYLLKKHQLKWKTMKRTELL